MSSRFPEGAAGAAVLQACFLRRRREPARLSPAVARAMALVGGTGTADPAVPALRRLAHQVAERAERLALSGAEHPYHNLHHAAETVLAMAALCRHALARNQVTPRGAACGVAAMVGHDLGHDGSARGGGVMEARSLADLADLLHPVPAPDRARIAGLILATDPERVAANAAAPPETEDAVLRRLANEADVFASLLPALGPRLSRLLAAEWGGAGEGGPGSVGTARGRLAFLRAYPPLSPAALRLGLGAARDRSVAAYAAAARLLGLPPTPEAGTAALDAMDAAAAEAAYAAALDTLPPDPEQGP